MTLILFFSTDKEQEFLVISTYIILDYPNREDDRCDAAHVGWMTTSLRGNW
jgi:hypothetical protein